MLLDRIRLVNIPFSKELPITPLHWMVGDQTGSLVVESVKDGIHIYENPVGVMTNNPTFDKQLFRLKRHRSAGRSFLRLPVCEGRLHQAQLHLS